MMLYLYTANGSGQADAVRLVRPKGKKSMFFIWDWIFDFLGNERRHRLFI